MTHSISGNRLLELFITPNTMLELSMKDWQSVILILRSCQMLARLALKSNEHELTAKLPEYAQHHFKNALIIADKQKYQIEYEAQQLLPHINLSKTYAIFLKGAAYSLANNLASSGRTYGDIDLLVKKSEIDSTERQLNFWGWLPTDKDEYDDKYYREWTHEIPPLQHGSRGTVLDLHHNFIPPISGKAPVASEFVAHSVKLDNGFYVLSPQAMTLHSAIHLFFNEEFNNGFRDIFDLHCLFTEYNSEKFWQNIISLAKKTEFTRELYLASRYCIKFYNTDIPSFAYLELSNMYSSKIQNSYWDWMFLNVLLPHHPKVSAPSQPFAIFMALVRGHTLKMPLKILLKHTGFKVWKLMLSLLFGKTFLDKEQNKMEP